MLFSLISHRNRQDGTRGDLLTQKRADWDFNATLWQVLFGSVCRQWETVADLYGKKNTILSDNRPVLVWIPETVSRFIILMKQGQ